MRLRLTKVDEYQFLTCLQYSLWGSKSSRFKDWYEGDFLAFIVDKSLAGLAQVSGKPFRSDEKVWDNGVFPHRIPMRFTHVLESGQRIPVLGVVRDVLTSTWGHRYGWGILDQRVLTNASADTIIKEITSKPNALANFKTNISTLLHEAEIKRELASLEKKAKKKRAQTTLPPFEAIAPKEEDSIHSQAQDTLIRLGKITGCSVWIALNDKNRMFRGKTLGEDCLKQLPSLGLSDEATRRISLIDVIWIKQNAPVCAFEVETTTSVYSGLLRMSDLLSVVPALNVKLYIVAPNERQERVRAELTRPTFKKIGLNDFCKFIRTEELSKLLSRVDSLGGHVTPTIVETIATEFGEEI